MNILRRFARGVRGLDDDYSATIADMYKGANPAVQAVGYMVGGAHPSLRKAIMQDRPIGPETRMQQLGRNAMEYGIPVVNAVPKYVLPAAGVTAAGAGLLELVRALSPYQQQPMSQQEAALVEMLATGQITDQEFYQMAQDMPK